MANDVTIKDYTDIRMQEIMDRLIKSMDKVKDIVVEQAQINTSKPPPGHLQIQSQLLYDSIAEYSHVEREGNKVTAVIGTAVPYGFYQEFGFRNTWSGQIVQYPWLFPAVEAKRDEIIKAILEGGGVTPEIEVSAGIWNE
jgi:hypothetical protein